jgi:hypothetical protein
MLIDPSQKFVAVQYMLPWEKEKNSNGMCLPCVRAATRIFFYDIMVVHSGAVVNGLIQRLYNKHSVVGEYKLSNILICPRNGPIENLPILILRHQRNLYEVHKDNNRFHMNHVNMDIQ